MKFPHANKFELGDRDFLALWKVWFDGTDSRSRYSSEGSVPRLAKNVSYQVLIDSGYGHGLDALCRLAVPPKYRNTKQATNIFVDANAHLIEHSGGCINHASDRMVKSVKLTQRAIDLLHEALTDQTLLAEAEAIIEADTEIISANGEIVQLTKKLIAEEPPSPKCASANLPFSDLQGIVQALVDDIQYDPFQTRYRKRPIGEIVLGWSNRLTQYFWPNPTFGYSVTMKNIAPLLVHAKVIADARSPWDEATKSDSLIFAELVFKWGGVPQRNLTAEQVEMVARAALEEEQNSAKMNSGWTKVAAFLTAHLERENKSQAIWDSRVSWSLVRRLDCLLYGAKNKNIPSCLQNIGIVPGRGGSRWIQRLNYKWPNGYGRWDSHLAASSLIRQIRDELNSRNMRAPDPGGGEAPWSVRTVEMVLFMDGY